VLRGKLLIAYILSKENSVASTEIAAAVITTVAQDNKINHTRKSILCHCRPDMLP
jgi:hypothetical protein